VSGAAFSQVQNGASSGRLREGNEKTHVQDDPRLRLGRSQGTVLMLPATVVEPKYHQMSTDYLHVR
jgi:hypothetical protein